MKCENNQSEPKIDNEELPQEYVAESPGDLAAPSGVIKGDVGTDVAQVWISAFLIAALGFVVYVYAFSIPLHGDDLTLFQGNASIARLVTSLDALPSMPAAPLSVLGLSLNTVLGGGNVDALHGGSILLHLVCAILVFLLARRLLPAGTPEVASMMAGMLFAVHPLTTETVNYLVARPVLQSAAFGLTGLLLLFRGCVPKKHGIFSLATSVVCFVLAYGSDAPAMYFPLIGIALLYLRGGSDVEPNDFRGFVAAVLLLVTALMLIAGLAAGTVMLYPTNGSWFAPILALLHQAGFAIHYMAVPFGFSVLPESGNAIVGGVVMLLLVAIIVFAFLRGSHLPVVLGAWIILALAGTALFGPSEGVGATRYLYVPWAATCIFVPWLVQRIRLPKANLIANGVAALLILVLAALSFQRSGLWTRPAELWAAERDIHPERVEPDLALGRFLVFQLNLIESSAENQRVAVQEASAVWKVVLEKEPDSAEALRNLGTLSLEQESYEEALEYLRRASTRQPRNQEIALLLAYAAEKQARTTGEQEYVLEALRALERSERLGPLPAVALERYGLLAAQMGDFSKGVSLLEQANEANPNDALAAPIAQFKTFAEQVDTLGATIEEIRLRTPQSPEILLLKAQRNLLEGRQLDTLYLLERLVEQDPANPVSWALLGYVCGRLDGVDNFLHEWGDTRAKNSEAWKQLAIRCGAGGIWSAAEAYLKYGFTPDAANSKLEIVLADIALELNQVPRATAYLQSATETYTEDPEPWLRLADLAIADKDEQRARSLIAEAEKRAADPEALKIRSEKLTTERPVTRQGITRTVIK